MNITEWLQWTGRLLVLAGLFLTPATTLAAPPQPQAFGPSSYLPLLRNNYCSGTLPESLPLGTQLYGPTGYNRPHFTLLQDTQTPWLRNSIYWNQIEPANVPVSQFNWSSVDSILRAATHNCLNIIATIERVPTWAATDGDRSPIKTENVDDFVDFMVALVERYDGDGRGDASSGIVVKYWEIFNEPDYGTTNFATGYGDFGARYAQLLQAIYDPIKAADPEAQVVFGGIAYNQFINKELGTGSFVREFFQKVLEAGGGDYFDYMNFHYYPFPHNRTVWTQTSATGLIEKYENLKALMDANNVDKPFMITEIGWHSDDNLVDRPSTPEFQARRVVELFAQSMSIGSKVTIWWTFFDEQGFPYQTGLTTAGTAPTTKPSYAAYGEALKRLGNSAFVEVTSRVTMDNDLEAYRFRENATGKTFYVAWLTPTSWLDANAVATFDDSATQNLRVPGGKATIFSKLGAQVQVITDEADGDDDNQVNIQVGRSPIYIVID